MLSTNAILIAGAKPIVDIDPITLNIDIKKLKKNNT